MSSPSAHPQLPLPFQTLLAQRAFWSQRLRPEKHYRYLFSFVSTDSWSSHFSLENNRQPLQLQTCFATRNFSFPLWTRWVLPSFLHQLLATICGGTPHFHHLHSQNRLGMSLTPSLLSCAVETQREKTQIAEMGPDMSGKLSISLPQGAVDVRGCHEFEGDRRSPQRTKLLRIPKTQNPCLDQL